MLELLEIQVFHFKLVLLGDASVGKSCGQLSFSAGSEQFVRRAVPITLRLGLMACFVSSWDRLGCPICQRPGCCWEVLEAFIDGNMILYYIVRYKLALNSHKTKPKAASNDHGKKDTWKLAKFPLLSRRILWIPGHPDAEFRKQTPNSAVAIWWLPFFKFQLVATTAIFEGCHQQSGCFVQIEGADDWCSLYDSDSES